MRRSWKFIVSLAVAASVLSACAGGSAEQSGSSDGAGDDSANTIYRDGMVNPQQESGEPTSGGTLTVAMFSEPTHLDPARTTIAGSTGGVELLNIFDSLMRYDAEEGRVVPHLAEDVTSNEDATEFTITLRPDVTFSDGTAFDSEAVKWSFDRYSATESAPEGNLWKENVKSIATPDPRTVVISLNEPYASFANMLSTGPGMIVAKSSDEGAEYRPIGAGPFTVESVKPKEETLLAANPNYWDGPPSLERLRFVYYSDEQTSLDALDKKSVDAGFFRAPHYVEKALDAERPGYVNMVSAAAVVRINPMEGRPGSDPRVRRAMALAVDPALINERVYEGKGLPSKELFPDYSIWYTGVEGLPHDPEEARRLVEEAKADGFDGRLEYLTAASGSAREIGLALKAQLDAVGFDVQVDTVRSVTDILQRGRSGDYDTATGGVSFRDFDPYTKLTAVMHSGGNQTYSMHTSPEMDALIEEFKGATSEDDQKRIMKDIAELYNEELPWLTLSPFAEATVWNDNVHGVLGASNSMVHFGNAWKN